MKKVLSVITTAVIFTALLPFSAYAEKSMPEISAKACVLIEEKTGRIVFEKNSDEKLPMASTTKIMTTLLCLESGNLDDEFIVDSEAIKVEGSSMGLVEGDVVTKRALCYGMLLPSGNDAANAVAVKLGGSLDGFADMMNKRASEIGMTRTCFVTPSGLHAEGHGSSAFDMAILAREALKNSDFAEICSQVNTKVHFGNPPFDRWLENSNKLLKTCEGVKGVKTGFTDEAGRCLVSACERDEVSLICVTLNDKNDWADHASLYDYGFEKISKTELSSEEILHIETAGGSESSVPVKAEGSIVIGTDGMTENRITTELIIPQFIYAPINIGDTIGKIDYYYDGKYIDSLPVKAMKTVEYKEKTDNKKNMTIFEKIKSFLFN